MITVTPDTVADLITELTAHHEPDQEVVISVGGRMRQVKVSTRMVDGKRVTVLAPED